MSEEGRTFIRGISSDQYGLAEHRRRQRAAPRVVHGGWIMRGAKAGYGDHGEEAWATWLVGPGDEPFLTQSLQVHLVQIEPGGADRGHGHQNEALFYILEGSGYEIHDGLRYDWSADDLVIVHSDCVHWHTNASKTERALAIVFKAKTTWLLMGLWQQGRGGPPAEGLGPREDWSRLWTPGDAARKKVVKPADTRWEDTPDGHVRILASAARTDVRAHSVDLRQQEIPVASRSGKHWHMADEVVYVTSGKGHSLHWDVEADIDDRYYARVATAPTRWDVSAGDVLYIPQNTVHQHFNDGTTPLVLLSGQNRIFSVLGYDSVVRLEDAPAAAGQESAAAGVR